MIYVIIGMSVLFVAIGFLVTERNAKYLLAGYNTMSEEERKKPVPMDKLFIDVGLTQSALEEAVRVGDLVTIRRPFVELRNDLVSGKAFDDRAAVAVIAVCLDSLRTMGHQWDVFGVATVQEEVGLRGAFTSTFGISPDVGIAIDVGFGRTARPPRPR